MPASPAFAAVCGDVLWCLGVGLLLAALRDVLGLAFGNGRLLCLLWDLLAFAAAAVLVCGFAAGVSASGVARWYMTAGALAGALGWRYAVSGALYALARALTAAAAWPFRLADRRLIRPFAAKWKGKRAFLAQKLKKKPKNKKKQLQKPRKVLYN